MIKERLENSGGAKLFSHINTLNPPEISISPIAPFVSDQKLSGDHWSAGAFYLGDEVRALGRIVQQRSDALADALRIKPSLLGFPGHAQVKLRDDLGIRQLSFAYFRFDALWYASRVGNQCFFGGGLWGKDVI